MQVQKISSPAFEGRIRIIKDPEKFAKQFNEAYQNLPPEAKVVSGSTNLTLSMSTGTSRTACKYSRTRFICGRRRAQCTRHRS